MFNYQKIIDKYSLEQNICEGIIVEIKNEFSDDEMMAEIHIVRALRNYALRRKSRV